MPMTNVLLLAHHFPPMGGPGTIRSVALVRYLAAYGYRPIVLTISENDVAEHWHPVDESMSSWTDDVEVIRVPTREPRKLKKLLRRYRMFRPFRFLFFPVFWESSALWPFFAFKAAKTVIEKNNVRLIYSTSSPFSSMLLALMLKIRLNVKWIADLRDPYTDGYMWIWPSKLHWLVCRLFERIIMRIPDRVVVNTPEVERLFRKRNLVDDSKLLHLTNGFLC